MKLIKILTVFLMFLAVNNAAFSQNLNITAKINHKIKITLDSNPTTGYQWALAKPLDNDIVKLISSKYLSPKSKLCGAGGEEVWTFKGIKKGETKIILKYARPWEKVTPELIKTYNVIIN